MGHATDTTGAPYAPCQDETQPPGMTDDNNEATVPTPEEAAGNRDGACILLVEDDDLVRQFVAGQLTRFGYRVIEAASGPEAINLLRQRNDIDLLFTDIVMPGGMNGKELAEQARLLHPGLKVLYTSGFTEDALVSNGRLEPGVNLLTKPYRRIELQQRVQAALARP